MYKRIDGLLAWIWLACLLLTLADWFSPLEITSQSLKAGVHCSIWLLVYPMSRHFNILDTGLAKMMWRGLIIGSLIACVLAFISVVAWPLIGVLAPPAVAEYLFFSGNGRGWRPDYVYFQRGSSLMLRQREGSTGWRDIQVTPITPFFQWAVPLPTDEPSKATSQTPGYAGWTAVQKEWAAFTRTPAAQRRLEANWKNNPRYYPRYKAAERREDSLSRLGRLPVAALGLPAATQQGANTFGCLFGEARDSWRDYSYCYITDPAGEVYCGIGSKCTPDYPSPGYRLQIEAKRSVGAASGSIYITLAHLTGPGVYRLGKNTNGNSYLFFEDSNHNSQYTSTANQFSFVRVTRFDTAAHVVAGIFEGYLDKPGNEQWLLLQRGRFDVNYHTTSIDRPRKEGR